METANFNQFKADILHFIEYAIAEIQDVSISTNSGTVTFTPGISDDKYIRSIPGLADSIAESMKSPRSEWAKVDTSSLENFKRSFKNV